MTERSTVSENSAILQDQPDLRGGLILNTYIAGQRLIGLSQPTDWSPEGMRTAGEALSVAHQSLQATTYMVDMSDAARLNRAIGEANDAVRNRNRMRIGHQHDGVIGVGLVLALRREKTATIAIIPPAAVALFQRGSVRWVPELSSWSGGAVGLDGSPLGWTGAPRPTFLKTQVDMHDQIAVVSNAVAEGLSSQRIACTTTDDLCQAIGELADRSADGATDLVAIVTRFETGTVTRNVLAGAGSILGSTDRRARAVWSAIRTGGTAPLASSHERDLSD
ncbi:MAG TPA: hypothetical protein PK819_00695 [Thermomicrobiales bacterium]|nr:hypothetical protein [Thermomicrobiales bacterium]